MKFSRGTFTLFLVGVVAAATPFAVRAAQDTVTLPAGQQTTGNYYAAGSNVEIDGDVESDLIVAGGTVVVKGAVGGDVLVAGGNVRILGPVTGNVRVLAGKFELASSVGHNLMAAANELVLAPGSSVQGNLTMAANQMQLAGSIGGGVLAGGGSVQILGTVQGPVTLWLGRAGMLEIANTGVLNDQLIYHSETQAKISAGAALKHQPQFEQWSPSRSNSGWWWSGLIRLFSGLVLGLLLVGLLPKKLAEVADQALLKPWPSLGWGAVWSIVAPITAILLLFTMIGVSVAVVIVAFYIITLVAAQVVAGAAIGKWFKQFARGKMDNWSFLVIVLVGTAAFKLLTFVPFLGGLVGLVGTLWGLGALLVVQKRTMQELR